MYNTEIAYSTCSDWIWQRELAKADDTRKYKKRAHHYHDIHQADATAGPENLRFQIYAAQANSQNTTEA